MNVMTSPVVSLDRTVKIALAAINASVVMVNRQKMALALETLVITPIVKERVDILKIVKISHFFSVIVLKDSG